MADAGSPGLLKDVRYGARMLRKRPAFTAAALLSLALGIGANTAIFSLIDAVMLKLLPVRDPRQLVTLTDPTASGASIGMSDGVRGLLSNREFEALRDRTHSYSGMMAVQSYADRHDVTIDGQPMQAHLRLVSREYFGVLGARAFIGRTFGPGDDHGPGAAPYAVANYRFWQERFGGNPSALGKTVRVGNATLTIIGVTGPDFRGESVGQVPDLWIPLSMEREVMPGRDWLQDDPAHPNTKVTWLQVIGRLKPGVTRTQAQAEADVVFKQIVAEEFSSLPEDRKRDGLRQSVKLHPAATGTSPMRGQATQPLYVLMGIVAIVLLIACANVANLLLARATARQKEIGIRLALGARRGRIIRQFLTESLLLSVAGGLLGVLVAVWGVHLLLYEVQSPGEPFTLDVSPDGLVLLFTIGISILTGLIFGLAPAWKSARVNVSSTLKEAGRGLTGSASRIGLGKALVTAQIAASVLLLIGAFWFVGTLRNLQAVDLGYARDHLLIVSVDPTSAGYQGERLPAIYREIYGRFQQIPGVRAVTFSQNGLFSGSESADIIGVEGYKSQKSADNGAAFDSIGPNYFSSLGIPILLGREIGPQDNETAPRVAVVNEAFAKFYFGKSNPVGKHIMDRFPGATATMEIVGVSRDDRDHSLRDEIRRRFYIPVYRPISDGYAQFVNYEIRTAADPGPVMQAVRGALRQVDPALPSPEIHTLSERVDDSLQGERVIARLSAFFGGLALLLACIGLYGVLSYGVALRTNEIGIRMALGADKGAVVKLILRETALLTAIGLAVGVPAALACARLVSSQLYGLKPADPLVLAGAVAIIIALALVSGYWPAARAAQVDPLEALRHE